MPLQCANYPHGLKTLENLPFKSPKVYLRDTGLFHALLDLASWEQLEGHPKIGSSWEGFCIEQVLSITGSTQAYFWGTHAGAELDLFLLLNGKRIGIEIKYSEAPSTTRSIRVAISDLSLDQLLVIYPGHDDYSLDDKIEVVSLSSILSQLHA